MKSMLNLLTNRYLQGGMSGLSLRADDVNEGFKDEERGQLRKSRVEVAENHILRKNR